MLRMRGLRVSLYTLVASLLVVGYAAAQALTTGGIQGSVLDPSGAALPGVAVEAKNVDTNISRSQTTGGEGRYTLLQLQPGTYSVTFTLSGFATLVQEGVNVSIVVSLSVELDSVLRVSTVAVPVTVTVSLAVASFMVGLSVTVWPTETLTPSWTSVAKPLSVNVTL